MHQLKDFGVWIHNYFTINERQIGDFDENGFQAHYTFHLFIEGTSQTR